MKILLFANTDWYLYNFRLSLASKLRNDGWDVVLVSPPGEYGPQLASLGFRWIPFEFSTRNTNPFKELKVLWRMIRLYRRERPSFCHHFTIKCVLYGSLAARWTGGVSVINAVTGLGHIFTDSGIKARFLRTFVRSLYRFILGNSNGRVVFQNSEDRDYFVSTGLVKYEATHLIRGSGVDCAKFKPSESVGKITDHKISILFASRMLREKGVFELLEAARNIVAKGLLVEFLFAGELYPGNPSSLSDIDILQIKNENIVTYLGQVDDMPELLSRCDIVVLPSYSEGTPRILIEAAAMGKPIVATDIAGCRGLVEDGVNGFLVPIKDVESLTAALELLVLDDELKLKFGMAGRDIVLRGFDESIVIEKTLNVYDELNLLCD